MAVDAKILLPMTAGLSLLAGPTSPHASLSIRVAPDPVPWPFEESVPDQPHLPEDQNRPIDGSTVVLSTASGHSNTSSQTLTTRVVSWELPSSKTTYDRDLEFAEIFLKRTGMAVQVRFVMNTS